MNRFYHRSSGGKLRLAIGAVLGLIVLLAAFAIVQLQGVNRAAFDVAHGWAPQLRIIALIKAGIVRLRTYELQHMLSDDSDDFDDYEAWVREQMARMRALADAYRARLRRGRESALFGQFDTALTAYQAAAARVAAQCGDPRLGRSAAAGVERSQQKAHQPEHAALHRV